MNILTSEYTVESILHLYKDGVRTAFDEKIVTLEGFYQKTGKQSYNGVYYDKIFDADKLHNLTIIIKDQQRKELISGQYYRFHGFLNRSSQMAKDGTIRFGYRVTKVIDQIDEHQFVSKEEFDLIRQRFDKDSVEIQGYLLDIIRRGKEPQIHILLGSTSIVDKDYKNQLAEDHIFNITEERVNFSNSNAFSECDKQDVDLLVCMRGGGSGLEVFNNADLAEQVINLKTPFITAIGHKEDITMVEKMADRGFATPTSVGAFLNSIQLQYEQEIKELSEKNTTIDDLIRKITSLEETQRKQETQYIQQQNDLENRYQELRLKDKELIKKLSIGLAAFILITVFFLWLFLSK